MLIVAPVAKCRRKHPKPIFGDDLLAIIKQPRSDIPAVTHADWSARVQTIARRDHADYYDLVRKFGELTGYSVIVNTSFNVQGEPIVCTPYDAYRCFMRTEMDVLILGNFLLLKDDQPAWPEHKGHVESCNPGRSRNHHDQFFKALHRLYYREFLPVATRLHNQQAVCVSTTFQRLPTTWANYDSDQTPQAIFSIPPELDTLKPDPRQMAAAITSFWTPGFVTEALRPILVKLLKMGQRFPETASLEERVDDSIYVMY